MYFIILLLLPLGIQAKTFDPNLILSDSDIIGSVSLNEEEIETFFKDHGSILYKKEFIDIDGVRRSAAKIILRAANDYQIRPEFLIALIQKEQGLITTSELDNHRIDWATGYGKCDSCSTSDPTLQKFKGFATQVEGAAGTFRVYYNRPETPYFKQAGKVNVIDGKIIIPKNQATANLYTYDPHISGNQILWNIWQDWFVRTYPDGVILRSPDIPGTWLIQKGRRRPFTSVSALISYTDQSNIIEVSKDEILAYPEGQPIKYANYSLLRSPRGTVYLIVGDTRRGIDSQETFRLIGFNPEEVIDVSWEDINLYQERKPITMASSNPTGILLQNNLTGGVYYVVENIKHPIPAREILQKYFKNQRILPRTPKELEDFETGSPVLFHDGELVKSSDSSTVYVISNGERRPIVSAETFEKMGWKWENVIVTSNKVINLHPLGIPI